MAGTTLLKDINSGANSSYPYGFTEFNGKLYFRADDGTNGSELWVTDGTVVGTSLFKDINPGVGSSSPYGFTEFNGKLYFKADDGANGYELWVTDGTVAGTTLLKDINPGANASFPTTLQYQAKRGRAYLSGNFDKLILIAYDDIHGQELWSSDGTSAGTVMLMDFYLGIGSGAGITD